MSATKPKQIALCFDGTGDWATKDETNVLKVYKLLQSNRDHVAYYSGGVGTLGNSAELSRTRRSFLKLLDLAVATSLRDHVLDGYRFIMDHWDYEAGALSSQHLSMFGFSRGAFTARVLAAMIHCFGLLRPENRDLLPYLWEAISQFKYFDEFQKNRQKIKDDFSTLDIQVSFLGLFDTVSSVGVFERFKVFPYTDKNPSVKRIAHAVSKHESRNAFPELLIRPSENLVREVWFDGVHRDVGGGCEPQLSSPDDGLLLEHQALRWMLQEAFSAGVDIPSMHLWSHLSKPKIHFPVFDPYVIAGLYPMMMFDYRLTDRVTRSLRNRLQNDPPGRLHPDDGFRWFWPNFKHYRELPQNALEYSKLTESDWSVDVPTYKLNPSNVLPDCAGIMLGVMLAVLFLNRGLPLGSNGEYALGPSWPHGTSLAAGLLFCAYLIQQGFSQALELSGKRIAQVLNRSIAALGILATICLATWSISKNGTWMSLPIAFCTAVVVSLCSLLYPSRASIMRADRAVAAFMAPWFLVVLGRWGLVHILCPVISGVVSWRIGAHWGLDLDRQASILGWVICIALFGLGIAQIVTDRLKMRPEYSDKKDAVH